MKTTPTAWVEDPCTGTNPACRIGIREGHPVHIIPSPHDPRAAEFTIALPDYHFATEAEGLAALEKAWADAPKAFTPEYRDACYRKGLPVKIAKGVRRP